jgi:DNA-3-methyladenine glycosylase II
VKAATRIRKDAIDLIERDKRFGTPDPDDLLIEVWGPGFGPLIHLILGQQVSIEAADAMYATLQATVDTVTPTAILQLDDETMRRCGFTRMKAEYARGLAQAEMNGLSLERLGEKTDQEIVETLVALRGIGRWTAECYLIFCLGRRDVFPVGDLALRVGYQELVGASAPPTESELARIAEQWAPRRTAAAYLVWHGYLERRGRV